MSKKVKIIYNLVDPLGFFYIGVLYAHSSTIYEYEITNRADYEEIVRLYRRDHTLWIKKVKQWPYKKKYNNKNKGE